MFFTLQFSRKGCAYSYVAKISASQNSIECNNLAFTYYYVNTSIFGKQRQNSIDNLKCAYFLYNYSIKVDFLSLFNFVYYCYY